MSASSAGSLAPSAVAPVTSPTAELLGFVDAIAGRRIFGWAWDKAAPEARLEIVVHGDNRALGSVTADLPREDLAAAGVGDGKHAFEFDLPPELDPASLRVAARRPDHDALAPLGFRSTTSEQGGATMALSLARLGNMVQTIVSSQSILHRNLQETMMAIRALREATPAAQAPLGEIRAAQEAVGQQLATLEIFMTRLDETLAAQAKRLTASDPPRRSPTILASLGLIAMVSFLALGLELARLLG